MSLLEYQDVSVYYDDFQALYDLNFKVDEGRSSPASVPTALANPPC